MGDDHSMTHNTPVSKAEYEALAAFRYGLRQFMRFSESAARDHGITPQQHQLLLAVKGFPGRDWATVSEVAERLQLQQQSVVGIIDRLEKGQWVYRHPHPEDHRVTEVHLTRAGESLLEALTIVHRQELLRAHTFLTSVQKILDASDPSPHDH